MPGAQERQLRRRIRSVQSIRKTTRAMELIAASRIMRAQQRIAAAQPYVGGLDQLAADLAAAPGSSDAPLLRPPDPGAAVALVVIASDRGLCGGYTVNVLRATERLMAQHEAQGRRVLLLVVGRRAISYLRYRGFTCTREFTGMTDRPSTRDADELAQTVHELFAAGTVGRVEVVSTSFRSVGQQVVTVRRLIPLDPDRPPHGRRADYEMEPERPELLAALTPRLLRGRLLLALLEAAASEHAARQRAMKAATDNADEIVTNLRRVMNRARQDAITMEIMDIVGGAEALRQTAEVDVGPSDSAADEPSAGAA